MKANELKTEELRAKRAEIRSSIRIVSRMKAEANDAADTCSESIVRCHMHRVAALSEVLGALQRREATIEIDLEKWSRLSRRCHTCKSDVGTRFCCKRCDKLFCVGCGSRKDRLCAGCTDVDPKEIVRALVDRLEFVTDRGPEGEGWQSDELSTAIFNAEQFLEGRPA